MDWILVLPLQDCLYMDGHTVLPTPVVTTPITGGWFACGLFADDAYRLPRLPHHAVLDGLPTCAAFIVRQRTLDPAGLHLPRCRILTHARLYGFPVRIWDHAHTLPAPTDSVALPPYLRSNDSLLLAAFRRCY